MTNHLATTRFQSSLHRGGLGWNLILCLLTALPAAAADDTADSAILAALGSDDYAMRETMTDRLLAETTMDARRIDQLFAQADSLEQRHRLMRVARHHLLRDARVGNFPGGKQGSLGVSIQEVEQTQLPEIGQPAIYIVHTYPGFPAYEKLHVGDMILSINGQKPEGLAGRDIVLFLQGKITEHRPGETVRLIVRRETKNIDVEVTLANMDALTGMFRSRMGQDIVLNNPMGQQVMVFASDPSYLPLSAEYEKIWRDRLKQLEGAAQTR